MERKENRNSGSARKNKRGKIIADRKISAVLQLGGRGRGGRDMAQQEMGRKDGNQAEDCFNDLVTTMGRQVREP